jgi:hypothetical protein
MGVEERRIAYYLLKANQNIVKQQKPSYYVDVTTFANTGKVKPCYSLRPKMIALPPRVFCHVVQDQKLIDLFDVEIVWHIYLPFF